MNPTTDTTTLNRYETLSKLMTLHCPMEWAKVFFNSGSNVDVNVYRTAEYGIPREHSHYMRFHGFLDAFIMLASCRIANRVDDEEWDLVQRFILSALYWQGIESIRPVRMV
jgi:hypothetical protein